MAAPTSGGGGSSSRRRSQRRQAAGPPEGGSSAFSSDGTPRVRWKPSWQALLKYSGLGRPSAPARTCGYTQHNTHYVDCQFARLTFCTFAS